MLFSVILTKKIATFKICIILHKTLACRMLSLTFACVRIVMMFFNSQKNLFRGLKFSLLQKRTLINFDNKNKTLKMNEAYFKHLSDEGKIAISFRFVQQLEEKKIDRVL